MENDRKCVVLEEKKKTKSCGCPRKGYVCVCSSCVCHHCDDSKYIGRSRQEQSLKPDKKFYFDKRIMSTNPFMCRCKDCQCHYCDDSDCRENMEQEQAPSPHEEYDFYNRPTNVCTAVCAKPHAKPDLCKAMKICESFGRNCI